MTYQICVFACVVVICVTILTVIIISNYPTWCTYYEYKDKAKNYDKLKEDYNEDIKEISKTINNIKDYFKKDSRCAYNLLEVILQIKIALKEESSTKAIERIKTILEYSKL